MSTSRVSIDGHVMVSFHHVIDAEFQLYSRAGISSSRQLPTKFQPEFGSLLVRLLVILIVCPPPSCATYKLTFNRNNQWNLSRRKSHHYYSCPSHGRYLLSPPPSASRRHRRSSNSSNPGMKISGVRTCTLHSWKVGSAFVAEIDILES